MSRRNVSSLAFLLALLIAVPASAQYLYLDANGDGIHTDQDLMPTSGGLDVDIWLVTNGNRAGDVVTCSTDPESLTINSYVLNLHAAGGTVRYGAFQNRMATFAIPLPSGQDSTDWENGAAGMYPVASGRYRLGTLHIDVVSGTPWIDIVPQSRFNGDATSFGSRCGGQDFDNTLKLGSDWFDVDGLESAAAGAPPVLEPIADLTLDEAATAARHVAASDPDGDALAVTFIRAPGFMSVTNSQGGSGQADVDLSFAPTYADAGVYHPAAQVSDGMHRREQGFAVTVLNVNRPPTIQPIADVSVEVGATARVPVVASDPDGGLSLTLSEAPPFATLSGSWVEIRPEATDAGIHSVRVTASDGSFTVSATFQVTVFDSGLHRAPVFEPVSDVALDERDWTHIPVYARAYDQDLVSIRLLQGPSYCRFTSIPNLGYVGGDLWFQPGPRDSGTAVVRLEAYTSLYSTVLEFQVHVRDKAFPPSLTWGNGCLEPGGRSTGVAQVDAPDLDSVVVSSGPLPDWAAVAFTGPGVLTFHLSPGPEVAPGDYPITLYVNRGAPEEQSWAEAISVAPYDWCIGSSPFTEVVDPPIPDAGGPYAGVAGAPLTLHASAVPQTAENNYRWTFGDGHAALGPTVSHIYAEGGTYRAIVRTSSDPLARDSVDVVIAGAYPARALLDSEPAPIRLSRATDACFTLAAASDAYDLASLDLSSLWLWITRGGVSDSIRATGTPASSGTVHVCFAHGDLNRLFAGQHGRVTVDARIQGHLHDGARVRAPVSLTVVGRAGEPGKVTVWPNPMNPAGTLSFETEQGGRVRVRVYDVSGRLVRTIWDGALEAGSVDLPFDGKNDRGGALGSGVYYYRIDAPDRIWRGRLTILK